MAVTNFRNTHLSEEKVAKIKAHLTALEAELAEINVNLTPEERRKLGSINEQNKLFVNRDYDFAKTHPALRAPQVDWEEFERDYKSRAFLTEAIDRMETQLQKLKNARILHDKDNLQDALTDYGYTSFMAGTGVAGYETKKDELGQFFKNKANKKDKGADPQPEQA